MTWDCGERPRLGPRAEVSAERVDRVIDQVMARIPPRSVDLGRRHWLGLVAGWLARPLPRFAMPMAAAAALGLVVGQHLQAAEAATQLAALLSATTIYGAGF